MTVTALYVPDPGQTDPQAAARAATLGIPLGPRAIPPQYASVITQTPGIVALSPGLGIAAFVHDDGTKTSSDVAALEAPLTARETADVTAAANGQTIQQRLTTNLGLLETFITNNPNGAVLTAAQTNVLARMLASTTRILLGLTTTVGGS